MYRSSLCNICKSPEHKALDCPFSWLREIDEVQHAIDQQQRQNDLELLPTETNSTQASANIPDPVNDTEMTDPSYVDLSHTEPSQAEASENPSEKFLSVDDTDEDLSEMDDSTENTPQLFDNSAPSLPATQPALQQQALYKLCSLNIRGFGNDAKQRSIFEFAEQSRADFIFLQETLATNPDAIDSLKARWPGKSFWSPALGKQGGVALLVSQHSCF